LAWRVHEDLRMNEQKTDISRVEPAQANPGKSGSERPLRICVVFDEDESAQSAEVLIRRVASNYECDRQSFRFDELDRPAPVLTAARSVSNADILVLTVREDQMLPSHVKSWLGLCMGLRDENQAGALVALIAEGADTFKHRSLLVEYVEAVAVIGRMAFFTRRGIEGESGPSFENRELEDKICGSFA
jgi:hypothetical protein